MVVLVLPNSVGWQSPNPKINLPGILMDKGGDIGASGRVNGITPCPYTYFTTICLCSKKISKKAVKSTIFELQQSFQTPHT